MSVFYILIGILMFGVLIAVHEAGHFSVSKLFHIKVNEFSIGMGPAIWQKQKGETAYSLRAFPVGGFCAIEGEDGSSDDPRAFTKKPIWQRVCVLLAGSGANLLTGFIIALCLYLGYCAAGDYMVPTARLAGFMEGCPYEGSGGLMTGDRIVSVNGWRVNSTRDFSLFMTLDGGKTVDLVLRRDGKRIKLEDYPLQLREYTDEAGNTVLKYGLIFSQDRLTLGIALREAWYDCAYYARVVWVSLKYLVSGRAGINDLSGPVGIVKTIGDVGTQSATVGEGLANVFGLIAFIAVNLAVMNLLPIPALDGGHIFSMIVFWLIGKIIRKQPSPKIESYIHTAGLVLLLGLMAFVMFNDIRKLF